MTTPEVSVLVPCWNAAGFVADALDSVAAQEGVSVEVLVVNDGSPDADRLHAVADGRPGVVVLDEPHRGLPASRNAGLRAARAPLVALLDADDVWRPGFLAAQVALLRETGADLVYCDAEFFGGSPKDGATVMRWHPSRGPVTVASLLAGTCVPVMSTIVARASALREVGGFDEGHLYGEDFDMWVRMAAHGATLAYTTDVRVLRRIHADNLSHDTERMVQGQLDVIRRSLPLVSRRDPLHGAVHRRLRSLRREMHLARTWTALCRDDAREARRALLRVAAAGGGPKHVVGALALALVPRRAVPFLRRRLDPAAR